MTNRMATAKDILQELETLPPVLQEEALDFIGYLKLKKAESSRDIREWNRFSLDSALRGMEDDAFPDYQESDLKELWK